ncbi:MAG: nuclear transport factor 2 family protein [Oscillatoriales cyanobacterium RU_3_3]|nr:nuclear transport factor 2 family protein [Oscillatoriales cyanobacterium RU_3_3]
MRENVLPERTLSDINNICEIVVDEYFLRLNDGNFAAVAELFSVKGLLCPPLGKAVCGREAIARYLQAEAKGMESFPRSRIVRNSSNGDAIYQIEGCVETSFFTVNVSWSIHLNAQKEITLLEVKLLNKLEDLVAFR